ncbi:hypothetical protein BTA51_09430 [Hahella sp. CCB-MM4]|nr:hypothetical protein BTA51_09430 [Hahella sp. CCB-MM4]
MYPELLEHCMVCIQKQVGGFIQMEFASALAIESPTSVRFLEGLEKDRRYPQPVPGLADIPGRCLDTGVCS